MAHPAGLKHACVQPDRARELEGQARATTRVKIRGNARKARPRTARCRSTRASKLLSRSARPLRTSSHTCSQPARQPDCAPDLRTHQRAKVASRHVPPMLHPTDTRCVAPAFVLHRPLPPLRTLLYLQTTSLMQSKLLAFGSPKTALRTSKHTGCRACM